MPRLIVCRNCTESDCTYCNMNILAVALERGYFNSLMREQHTVQIDSELVPVKHGHNTKDGVRWFRCSECGWGMNDIYMADESMVEDFDKFPYYCPYCGAKMNEDRDYEHAVEQLEHDMKFEPTYNPEDGSM